MVEETESVELQKEATHYSKLQPKNLNVSCFETKILPFGHLKLNFLNIVFVNSLENCDLNWRYAI